MPTATPAERLRREGSPAGGRLGVAVLEPALVAQLARDARDRGGRQAAGPREVKVANVGRRSGEHIVLAFVERPDGGRQLVAFDRVRLDKGDGVKVKLSFPVSRLAVTQASGERAVTPGTYELVVGKLSRSFRVG